MTFFFDNGFLHLPGLLGHFQICLSSNEFGPALSTNVGFWDTGHAASCLLGPGITGLSTNLDSKLGPGHGFCAGITVSLCSLLELRSIASRTTVIVG